MFDHILNSPIALRFVKEFGGQAFRLYELRATLPDPSLYPTYDDRLAQAMERETEMFLTELIASNEGISSVIDADFTFVNRQLAEHYGLEGIEGERMRRVSLPKDSPRGGLMTQASILKVTANGTTTSPVPRGHFVLSHILGQEPPPPPPGVGAPAVPLPLSVPAAAGQPALVAATKLKLAPRPPPPPGPHE